MGEDEEEEAGGGGGPRKVRTRGRQSWRDVWKWTGKQMLARGRHTWKQFIECNVMCWPNEFLGYVREANESYKGMNLTWSLMLTSVEVDTSQSLHVYTGPTASTGNMRGLHHSETSHRVSRSSPCCRASCWQAHQSLNDISNRLEIASVWKENETTINVCTNWNYGGLLPNNTLLYCKLFVCVVSTMIGCLCLKSSVMLGVLITFSNISSWCKSSLLVLLNCALNSPPKLSSFDTAQVKSPARRILCL